MSRFLANWQEITTDKIILSWIRGYKIPFRVKPFQAHRPLSPQWSKTEISLIKEQIEKLSSKGVIKECKTKKGQFLSGIFIVPKPNGSYRLILNLKKLNEFIEKEHFKLEDIKTVIRILNQDDFLVTLDLTDAFHLVSVHEADRMFLRFEFLGQLYEFTCVPFGLCTAPYVFTKIMKPVVYLLRLLGLVLIIYLDDFLILAETYQECLRRLNIVVFILENLGFIINREKSQFLPTRRIRFLGLIFDSFKMCVELPDDKKELIFNQIVRLEKKSNIKIREFAEVIGRLCFATNAVQFGQSHIKKFEREKFLALECSNGNFDAYMAIKASLKVDFDWWKEHIFDSCNPIKDIDFQLEIFSDASLTGWGAYCLINGKHERTHGHWDFQERESHINVLELKAALFGLICFAKEIEDCDILLRIDNTTAISYINRMGGIQFPKLNEVARQIWDWCEERNIWIFASYIKSEDNKIADSESRVLESGSEYEISRRVFEKIKRVFGEPEIDLFASRINKKCETYVAWHKDPFAFEIDAFTMRWNSWFFYAFPPFPIILKVLRKIKQEKASGIVVVPYWPAQPWYPVFLQLLIGKPLFFQPDKDLLFSSDRHPHPLWRQLTLVVGKLSGRRTGEGECQKNQYQ